VLGDVRHTTFQFSNLILTKAELDQNFDRFAHQSPVVAPPS
jgi:hypothetical protein